MYLIQYEVCSKKICKDQNQIYAKIQRVQLVFQILCTQTDNLFSHFFEGNHNDKFDVRVQMIDGADSIDFKSLKSCL